MTAKHTPGPWIITKNQITTTDRRIGIASISNGWIGFEDCPQEVTANADLIAAAPDLLAALQKAEKYVVNAFIRHKEAGHEATAREASDTIDILRAAIAKATGATASQWTVEYRAEAGGWEVMQGSAHRGIYPSEEAAHALIAQVTGD